MNILITGNMGYVGPVVVSHLRATFPTANLTGYDMGYFAANLTNANILPESKLDKQLFGDVRSMPESILQNIDAVIHLAAISNDPMGSRFEDVTMDINFISSIRVARMAKAAGVKSFVFASSCSIYGAAEDAPKTESSKLNPLTAYARSKVFTEKELEALADDSFTVTCLRFATACGMSPRLRLDLVLNDFVASAVASGIINILSDGSPWRPLIHVKDMARAIEWAIQRPAENGGEFLAVNTGCKEWNYQVRELAETVAKVITNVQVIINQDAPPDKRSYRVEFKLFASLAPYHQPQVTLPEAVTELEQSLKEMNFQDADFRASNLMRLKVLTSLQENNELSHHLQWKHSKHLVPAAGQPVAATL